MKFLGLTPELFWSLFGGMAAIIALLYILKLRRRRVTVPFSPIWSRVVASTEARRWWEVFKRFLSFLLQCVFAALVILAIADPHPEEEELEGREVVLLLDTSASMQALDVTGGVDRFDVARKEALKILQTLGPKDSVMLVTMDGQLRPLTPFVKKSAILEQQLRELRPSATPANVHQAMQFVRDAVKGKADAEVYLFSDGAFGGDFEEARKLLPSAQQLRLVQVGESGNNVAITAFNVRRYLANPLDYEIYVEVRSTFDREVEVELQLYADGELMDVKQGAIKLAPGGTQRIFFPNEGFSAQRLEARVKLTTADARDVFRLDDTAYAVLPRAKKLNVALVTDENLFLEATLIANDGNVTYSKIAPGAWTEEQASRFDAVILDRVALPQAPESGAYLFIAPPEGSAGPWSVQGVVERPIITATRKGHPLLRYLSLKTLEISQAQKLTLKAGKDDVAASAFGSPMIVGRREKGLSAVAVAFDLRQSAIPLRVALPLLILNALDWLTDTGDSIVPTWRTGEAWSIPVSRDAQAVTITSPSGEAKSLPVYEGRAIFYGEEVGFHEVKTPQETFLVAANLANPRESNIKPGDSAAVQADMFDVSQAGLSFQGQDWWIYLVLAAILLLLVEWVTFNRRWTV